MNEKQLCPVCGNDGLEEEAFDENGVGSYDSCDCCGFEYGYSESHEVGLGFIVTPKEMLDAAFQLYRKKWIENGAIVAHPEYYSKNFQENGKVKKDILLEQLQRLNLDLDNLEFLMGE
ncbi:MULTISPECIES: hypothetical protein [Virgibacillus]|uniref:Uncharacterized protein n=1 Tax=Virgibacillus pantothenticus TaxID=1473 RepID=A0A0L0QQ44_VIRPA|nr:MULTISPECIES: hypothetical protein [Virgibacillus]API90735.1 hypothetical protein BKP57_01970 [Virgibacillus sp. 6R]KNE20684.1 hypothetical protein AFK71_20295 [Virgibacillus pantothenticus]MBS7427664.1 hypothetical protein [Virgibacillus sp. 19R1-5]MBU8566150.1 hypothetical protein [Virgibacillus pantothenticus]MBU8600554.1 hypothetical protein [Virgibacillus pantothenticus]